MKCPYCHETENRVIDSRLSKDNNMIRRRRECGRCNRRFTTYERVEEMMPLVVKKDGRRESYDRSVDVHINNLRKKLALCSGGNAEIENIRGVGYRLRLK